MSQTKAQLVGGVGFSTADNLTVHNGLAVIGVVTATSFAGNFTGTVSGDATGLAGTPNIEVGIITATSAEFTNSISAASGTFTAITATSAEFTDSISAASGTFTGNVTIGGTLTYEDVTNIDSIGIVTARSGINITGAGMTVTGIGTFRDSVNLLSGASVTGVVTATSFDGGTGTFSGDVDIADKIVHTGDTDTAIRFSSDNTFTVETGGSEALRVDSSQIVSVNNPNAVYSSSDNFVVHNTDAGARIAFQRQDSDGVTAGEELGSLSFYTNDGDLNPSARIAALADDTHASGDKPGRIVFSTVPDGSATMTERLRITSAGNVSIQNDSGKFTAGTSDDLQIYHNGTHSYIDDTGTGDLILRGAGQGIKLQKYTGETMAHFLADGAVTLYHDDSQKFATKSDGIDVTGEVQCDSLDVDGSADFTGDATFRGGAHACNIAGGSDIRLAAGSWTGDYTGGIKIQPDGSNSYFQYHGSLFFRDTASNNRVSINQSGNLSTQGTIADSLGNVRRLGVINVSSSRNFAASDAGQLINLTGAVTLTIPSNTFTPGDMVSIYNNTTANRTIAAGSGISLKWTANGSNGSRTLAAFGMATLVCTQNNGFALSGFGIS